MKNPEKKNAFISHYHGDEKNIIKLKELIGDRYDLSNYSVTSEKFNNAKNDEYIKTLLRPRISAASEFICLIGPQTHNSDWVNWEIEQAAKQGKHIIGVYCNGASDADVPENLEKFADAIVGWRSEKIENALKGVSTFEKANGENRPSITIQRTVC